MKIRTLLGVVLIYFSVAHAYESKTFPVLDVMKILNSDPPPEVNALCADHLKFYLTELGKGSYWAVKMFDSVTKFPDGILMGRISIPGHFDECVEAFNEKFSGKHCMTSLVVKGLKREFRTPNFYHKRDGGEGFFFSYGICIPSTCNATDIENAIKNVEDFNFLQVNVSEDWCTTKEFRPFRTEDWVVVGILIAVFIIAAGSTAYDLINKIVLKNEAPNKLWTSFSIYTNGKHLFSISQNSSQLKCLHGIRFLSMCWVILGHSYFSFLPFTFPFGPAINNAKITEFLQDKSFLPVSNAFVSVDSFFFLSGLLLCLVFFRDISKKKTFDVPVAFIHRYMRLTPPFALLMLIHSTIISRIGNGPFWNSSADYDEKACRESWWSGLLYVQNYVKPEAMCLGQAWYLSADMQMYWVSPLILYPIYWFPSFAPFILLLLVLTAAFTNFAIAFVNDLAPNLLLDLNPDQFKLEYSPFHTRMAPWIVGMATGYIICGLQAKKIRFNMSKMMIMAGWVAAMSLLGGSLFGVTRFVSQKKNVDYTTLESAFYLSFHRVGWALGMAWVVIACVAGYGGPINDFLSWDIFQPLGKLSYCNFLIHMTLQKYKINSLRTNLYIRHFDVVYGYFADIVVSNLISIPLVLLFEIPFTNLDRHFLQKLVIFPLPKPKKENDKKNEEKPKEPVQQLEDLEKGKENPAFCES